MYLIAFDMDGTITKEYSWQDLVKECGEEKKSEEWMKQYYEGIITYMQWVENELNVFIKNKLHRRKVKELMETYTYIEGFKEFLDYLDQQREVKKVIISSGICERIKHITYREGFDNYTGTCFKYNREGFVNGYLKVVTPEDKREYLQKFKNIYRPKTTIVIGDSDFDIPMMEIADIRISVNNIIHNYTKVEFHGNTYTEIKNFFEKEIF